MPFVICRRSDGVPESAARWDHLAHDAATHVEVEHPSMPDFRTSRWDGGVGLRAATSQELTDYDAGHLDAEAPRVFDEAKVLRALAVETLIEVNALRAAVLPPLPALTVANWRARIINRYKAL